MTVASVSDFAECMKCWKAAEFARFEATLYASHAQELCGTALDDTSATCSNLGCTSPLPVQHDLGSTGENDCQRGIAKAGFNYLIKVEHQIEKCMLKGNTRGACLADPTLQLKLAAAETSKQNKIHDKCGNRDPVANPPFQETEQPVMAYRVKERPDIGVQDPVHLAGLDRHDQVPIQ